MKFKLINLWEYYKHTIIWFRYYDAKSFKRIIVCNWALEIK